VLLEIVYQLQISTSEAACSDSLVVFAAAEEDVRPSDTPALANEADAADSELTALWNDAICVTNVSLPPTAAQ
jgi:hypothetical protein